MNGLVFDIKKFAINDGPGIRTAVFLKGCPLHCIWCHNPESQKTSPEIFFMPDKCIGCGWCFSVCPRKCHVAADTHVFDRTNCIRCGKCTEKCYAGALELVGRSRSAEDVLAEVMKDEMFYRTSGGGLTVSGGEPMLQFDFTLELLRAAKEKGLHVCLDTCGYADPEKYRAVMPYVDLFLYDVKSTDSALHRKVTGVLNELILSNLRMIDGAGKSIFLRCPLVPGINDREDLLTGIADLANSLGHVEEITVEPYHPLGMSKFSHLGEKPALDMPEFAGDEDVKKWISIISAKTSIRVLKG